MSIRSAIIPGRIEGESRWERAGDWLRAWRPGYNVVRRILRSPRRTGDVSAWIAASIAWDKAHPIRYRLWRIYLAAVHPWTTLENATIRPIQLFIQRGRRGWTVEDTWDIDGWFVTVMPAMLDHLRKHSHGWPGEPMTPEEWSGDGGVLDQMAQGFRAHHALMEMTYIGDEPYSVEKHAPMAAELQAKADAAMALFARWFPHLWD